MHLQPTRLLLASLVVLAPACRRPSPTGEQFDPSICEPSGVITSARHEGVLWTHPDSGCGEWLYAVEGDGKLLAKLEVEGVDNHDWEDIARDDQGNIWLGDIGNNFSERQDLVVHQISEPDPHAGEKSITVDHSVRFSYPDQDDFDDSRGNFDAEALFWWQGTLWLATKHRRDSLSVLYRFPRLDVDAVVLERIGEFDVGVDLGVGHPASRFPGMTTAADVSPDQRYLALLSYDAVFLFELSSAEARANPFAGNVHRVALDPKWVDQVEALTWEGERLLLVNEDGAIFRIDEPLSRGKYP